MKNLIIGITGKSCSGKNTVGEYLKTKGFDVLDLDREAEEIRNEKGSEILKFFGTCDKAVIRKTVFSDPEKLKALESIIYPALEKRILEHEGDLVINGATIKRAGMDRLCSFIIFTRASYFVRLKRALERDGISENEFLSRENAQKDIMHEDVYSCPCFVLDTDGGCDFSEVDKIISKGRDRCASDRRES